MNKILEIKQKLNKIKEKLGNFESENNRNLLSTIND